MKQRGGKRRQRTGRDFFKQTTAYKSRGSGWSADVGSADLEREAREGGGGRILFCS